MEYLLDKVNTIEECDHLLQKATKLIIGVRHKLSGEYIQYDSITDGGSTVEAELVGVNAEISGLEMAVATMPAGAARTHIENRIYRLNHRKYVIELRKVRYGILSLLPQQLDVNCLILLQTEIEAYIQALNQRKAEIG